MDVKLDEMVRSMRIKCELHGVIQPYAVLCSPKAYWELMESPEIVVNYDRPTALLFGMNIYVKSWVPDGQILVSDEKQIKEIISQMERGYEVPEMKPVTPKTNAKHLKGNIQYGKAVMSDNAVCCVTLKEGSKKK